MGKKNLCGLHIKKNWLRLDLPLTSEEANNTDYYWSEKWGGWGYYHLEKETKLNEALELIKKTLAKFQ